MDVRSNARLYRRSAEKKFSSFMLGNPLISLDSNERIKEIQGNQTARNRGFRGDPLRHKKFQGSTPILSSSSETSKNLITKLDRLSLYRGSGRREAGRSTNDRAIRRPRAIGNGAATH
jgi:hypothetical protein